MEPKANFVREWIDNLERGIENDALRAGLLEHGTLVGLTREFIIKRFLKTILPPIVRICTGKIVDSQGRKSKQIDIILYDARFPVFEMESGIGMYPIEGVIATIEVKSTLNKSSFREALENAESVINLSPHMKETIQFRRRVEKYKNDLKIISMEAQRRASYEFIPATYMFSFKSRLGKKGLSKNVDEWFNEKSQPSVSNEQCAVLPRIIIAGKTIGLLDDGYILLDPGKGIKERWIKEHGPNTRPLMSFWSTKQRFGIMASHILYTITNRLKIEHGSLGVVYAIENYLPIMEYFLADMKGKEAYHNCWKENKNMAVNT